MHDVRCKKGNKDGYRLHVGHPVLGKLYNHFRLEIGRGLMACAPKQRIVWEKVVMAYYAKLYKKQYGHKLDLTSYMQELRLAEIIEQSDVDAAKAVITAKAVEKLRKDDEIETSKAVEAC